MKITNRLGLSPAWVIAAQGNYVKVGDYSVSELTSPVQQTLLRQRHDNEIVIDIADRTDIIFGQAMHKIAELAAPDKAIVEEGISINIYGKEVGGRPDYLEPKDDDTYILRDYKSASAWQWVRDKGNGSEEWVIKGNVYRYLLKLNGIKVSEIIYEAWFKDWSKKEAMTRGSSYPQEKVAKYILPFKSDEYIREFLEKQVMLFEENKKYPDDMLQNCSEDERWVKETGFAVVHLTGKSKGNAVRNGASFKTRSEADSFLKERIKKKGQTDAKVMYRCGESTRCRYYCDVKDFCNQWKTMNSNTGEPF